MDNFVHSYRKFGIHVLPDNTVKCFEWAPGAEGLYLRGDFNEWALESHPYKKLEFGKWELTIPPLADGSPAIKHLTKVKLVVRTKSGELVDRLSPWAPYVVQPDKSTGVFIYDQVIWNPPKKYEFQVPKPERPRCLRIYESHVGIASSEYKVATYREFADNVIPRIKRQGLFCLFIC